MLRRTSNLAVQNMNSRTIERSPERSVYLKNTPTFKPRTFLRTCTGLIGTLLAIAIVTPSIAWSQLAPVNLGSAADYVLLAKTGISTTGVTSITGDIAVSPIDATAITGFGLILDPSGTFSTSSLVTGKIFAADYTPPTPTKLTTAVSDMETAYTDAAGRTLPDFTELHAGDLTGKTLTPGLYKWGTGVLISAGGVTLSGSATDVWIFQIAGKLTVANGAIITLTGGAQASNIFWQVADNVTLGTTSDFKGNILCMVLIDLQTGAKFNGRALAQSAITADANSITKPALPPPDGGVTFNPTSVNFGSLEPGISLVRRIGAKNNGTSMVVASASVTGPNFQIISARQFSLNAGSEQFIEVSFTAPSGPLGDFRDTLVVLVGSKRHLIPLTATVTLNTSIGVFDPPSLDFGLVDAGTSMSRVVSARNIGTVNSNSDASTSGPDFQITSARQFELVAGGQENIEIRFSAASTASGLMMDTLVVLVGSTHHRIPLMATVVPITSVVSENENGLTSPTLLLVGSFIPRSYVPYNVNTVDLVNITGAVVHTWSVGGGDFQLPSMIANQGLYLLVMRGTNNTAVKAIQVLR